MIVQELSQLQQQTQMDVLRAGAAGEARDPHWRRWLVLCAAALAIGCGLLIYAETMAFYWDEGFHVLAAQLIGRGSRPYLDFFFPQPPLNTYWNAAWMRVFGESWRVVHAAAAIATGTAVLFAADFVYRTFPFPAWRLAAGLTTVLCFGLNTLVVTYATVGQAYSLCLLLIVVAFRLALVASVRASALWAWAAGLASGAAAGCSLLTAPIGPVLLAGLLWHNQAGGRVRKSLAFIFGGSLPFVPVAWLALHDFQQVFFNIVEYHLFYRKVGWSEALPHGAEVMSSWFDSGQALLLIVLALCGLLFATSKDCPAARSREYYICAWLIGAQALWLCNIHPTFPQYFVFVVPFLAILAPAGLHGLVLRFDSTGRPLWPVLLIGAFIAFGLEKSLFEQRGNMTWRDVEAIAAKVNEVTESAAPLVADEFVYFASKRVPPRRLEHADVRKLPPALAARLGLISGEELESRVLAGQFATLETCNAEFTEKLGLKSLYHHSAQFEDCTVYWDVDRSHASPAAHPPNRMVGATDCSRGRCQRSRVDVFVARSATRRAPARFRPRTAIVRCAAGPPARHS